MSYPQTGNEVYVSFSLSNTMFTGIGKGTITREDVSVDYLKELKEKEINAQVGRIVKRNGRIKKSSIIVAWILLGAVAVAFVMMWTLGAFAEDSAFIKTYQQYDMQIAIGSVILDGIAWAWAATTNTFGLFSTDKDTILEKITQQNP